MGLQWYIHADYLGWMVAGLVGLAVAAWMLRIDARNRVNQYFVAWMVERALSTFLLRPVYVETDAGLLPFWRVVDTWQAVFIAAWGAAYLLATSGRRVPRWLPAPIVIVALSSIVAAFLRPEWFASAPLDDPGAAVSGVWWNLEEIAEMTVLVALAFLLAVRYVRTGATRSHDLLAAGGLVAWVTVWQTAKLVQWMSGAAGDGADFWGISGASDARHYSLVVQLPLALAAGVVAAYGSRAARARLAGRYLLMWTLVLFAAGAVRSILLTSDRAGGAWASVASAIPGVVSIALPIGVALAMVKDQHIGLETRIERGFGRAALATALVLAFFFVSEATQGWIESASGSALAGLVAAGVMALGAGPLQRLGRRLARMDAAEHATPKETYRRQFSYAIADGSSVDGQERRRLDQLGDALGLSEREKVEIEAEGRREA